MKHYPILAIVVVVALAVGLLLGREYFPKPVAAAGAQEANTKNGRPGKSLFDDRGRSGGDTGGGSARRSTTAAASAASLADLFEMVDTGDTFATANRLRDALENRSAQELESLLVGLEDHPVTDPKLHSARSAIFNYFALADPARAVAFTLEHPEKAFRLAFTSMAIKALALSDLGAAKEALDQIDDRNLRIGARNALITVAIETDPGAVASLLSDEDNPSAVNIWSSYGSYGFGGPFGGDYYGGYPVFQSNNSGLIGQWALKNPLAAETYAREIEDPNKRSAALGAIAQSRAQEDPEGALAWARALDKADGKDNAVMSVLGVMLQSDPQRVAGMLGELDSLQQRSSLISGIANSWIKQDRAAGLAWLESLPSSQARAQAYNSALYQLTQQDPVAATGLLDKLPLNSRAQAIPNIASQWAQKDFAAARDWVTGLDDPVAFTAGLDSIFAQWSKDSPGEALDFLESSPRINEQKRSSLYTTLAGQWAQQDQAAALEWAQGIADEAGRRSALSGLYNGWATRDPAEAAVRFETVIDPVERQALLNSLANQWVSRDSQAAMEWFGNLDEADRSTIGSSMVQNLSYSDPQGAAAWYDRMVAEGALTSEIQHSASNIAAQWTQHDPVAAADWAGQLEDEQARKNAVESVTASWIQFDPIGVSAWVSELPAGELRDGAAERIVNQVIHVDPASAFDWAQAISDEQKRFQATRNVVRQWANREKEAARQAVAGATDLSAEQRQQLQDQLK